MTVDAKTVRKVARLARLEVTDSDVERLTGQMNGLLKWIDQLNEVNTDGVEPLANVVNIDLTLRPDQVTDGGYADAVLANAPEATQGFFVVPKVVE